MFFLSRHQPLPLLGLDISPSAIRLVELSRNRGGQHVLERCAIEAMEPGWIVDGRVEQFDAVAEVLRRLLRRVKARTTNVAMALPAAAVITRRISLPAGLLTTDRPALDARVRAEAGLAIPLPLQEVYLDYSVITPSAAQPDATTEVLLVATRRERVQDLQGLAEAAGLAPVIVDVASYAARRAARRLIDWLAQDEARMAAQPQVAMFEWVGHTTRLQILQGDEVIYERDPAFGTVTPPDVAQAVRDMAAALDLFQFDTSQAPVHAILLIGDAAVPAGLSEAVTQQLGIPCHLANPFEGMNIGRALLRQIGGDRSDRPDRLLNQHLGLEVPAYLTACGLALRRFMP